MNAGTSLTLIALLRAVNVGGNCLVKMEALRSMFLECGARNVKSYLQSGNVVFTIPRAENKDIRQRLEKTFAVTFGFRTDILLRTPSEMRELIERNPMPEEAEHQPSKLLILFLATGPGPDAINSLQRLPPTVETLKLSGSHLYIFFPGGIGRSKLSMKKLEQCFKCAGTTRNWNTVRHLLALADAIEVDS